MEFTVYAVTSLLMWKATPIFELHLKYFDIVNCASEMAQSIWNGSQQLN